MSLYNRVADWTSRMQRRRHTSITHLPSGFQVKAKQGRKKYQVLSNGLVSYPTAQMLKRLYVVHNITIAACTVRTGESSIGRTNYWLLRKFVDKHGDRDGVAKYYEWANDPTIDSKWPMTLPSDQ